MRGITVTLYEKTQTGVDALNHPIYAETPVQVDNVLIGEPTADDITTSTSLFGKQITYMLGIPKGDTHNWKDSKVTWDDGYGLHAAHTFGFPITGVEANIPGPWHMKVRCEAYG